KGSYNVASVAAGTACANAVVAAFGRPRDLTWHGWLVLAAAVFINLVVNTAALTAVTALVQDARHLPQLLRAFGPGIIATAVNTTLGLVMLLALDETPWSALLLAALAIVLGAAYRGYAQFVSQHKSLAEIHEITRATS